MTFIHANAHVDPDVKIGEGTTIWQFASVTRGTILGKNCRVSPHVMLDGSQYGDNTIISSGVKAGAGFKVGNNVFLGPNVVLCNDVWPMVNKIGYDDEKLRSGNYFSVIIEDNVIVGANATILPGIRIGHHSVIAAGAVVDENVPSYCLFKRNGAIKHQIGEIDYTKRMKWAR